MDRKKNGQGKLPMWQEGLREYSDSMNSQTYQENLASKQYADTLRQQQIDLALQMGDYKKLAAMGYDVSYLKRMQDAELEQLALDAMLTRANIAKVNSSVTRGSGGGTRSSKGGKGGDKDKDKPPKESLTITNRDNGAAYYVPGLRWVSYKDLDKMVNAGTVKETVDGGKVTYKKVW